MPSGTYAVVLATTQENMKTIQEKIAKMGIFVAAISENDELMALGIEPLPREEVKKYVSSLPLLK
jgi:hypothetical protein